MTSSIQFVISGRFVWSQRWFCGLTKARRDSRGLSRDAPVGKFHFSLSLLSKRAKSHTLQTKMPASEHVSLFSNDQFCYSRSVPWAVSFSRVGCVCKWQARFRISDHCLLSRLTHSRFTIFSSVLALPSRYWIHQYIRNESEQQLCDNRPGNPTGQAVSNRCSLFCLTEWTHLFWSFEQEL